MELWLSDSDKCVGGSKGKRANLSYDWATVASVLVVAVSSGLVGAVASVLVAAVAV